MIHSKQKKLTVSYILIVSPVPNTFLGGLMVTDSRGLPVEFRYTEPIQPTKIQQVLYGQILSSYIKQEVILETLLKSCESKPGCLIVEDESLLEAQSTDLPIFRLLATKSAPIGEVGTVQDSAPGEVLLQVSSESSPVKVSSCVTPFDESVTSAAVMDASSVKPMKGEPYKVLLEAAQTMDITEPLDRIRKALGIICQEIASEESGSRSSSVSAPS